MLKRTCLLILFAAPLPAQALDLGDLLNQALPKATTSQPAATPSSAANLSGISSKDQTEALKQALLQGAETAVKNLGQENGYLGNAKVRIPLPAQLEKAETLMRKIGMGKYADELVTSMNRAAEAAAPEARTLLVDAAKKMTVADAQAILTGGDEAATQYFRKNTETALSGKFRPIISNSMKQVKLAEKYDQFASKGAQFGIVDERDAKLEDYITRKAMDGLFAMMAEQEKAIRANPLEATGALAKQVFSALR